jgi:hypothetical protein
MADDARDLLAFHRAAGEDHALVLVNNSTDSQHVNIPLPGGLQSLRWVDQLRGTEVTAREGTLRVVLPPVSGLILRRLE